MDETAATRRSLLHAKLETELRCIMSLQKYFPSLATTETGRSGGIVLPCVELRDENNFVLWSLELPMVLSKNACSTKTNCITHFCWKLDSAGLYMQETEVHVL